MHEFAVDHEVRGDAVVVCAEGEVDSNTVDRFSSALATALDLASTHSARLVVVDLQRVTYFGSAGLNALLRCHDKAAAGTSVRVVSDNAAVTRPIEVTKLNSVLALYPTMGEALAGPDHKLAGPDHKTV